MVSQTQTNSNSKVNRVPEKPGQDGWFLRWMERGDAGGMAESENVQAPPPAKVSGHGLCMTSAVRIHWVPIESPDFDSNVAGVFAPGSYTSGSSWRSSLAIPAGRNLAPDRVPSLAGLSMAAALRSAAGAGSSPLPHSLVLGPMISSLSTWSTVVLLLSPPLPSFRETTMNCTPHPTPLIVRTATRTYWSFIERSTAGVPGWRNCWGPCP